MTMLEGIRVIELGTTITAPLAAMMLADLGADIVKVERPGGDPFRSFRGGLYSPHFAAYNRNKRSVILDLALPDDRERLQALIADADVFIDNLRPNVLPRLGLEPAALRVRFPKLIHCSITGFGATGPYRDRPAFDAVAQALSGVSSLFLDPSDPEVTGPTISDNVTGMYAAYGILGALYERTKTGVGRRLEVNMLESTISFIPDAFASVTQLGIPLDPYSRVAASQSFVFRCGDGKMVAVHLSSIEKFWTGLLEAADAAELATDARFTTRMLRVENYLPLRDALSAQFAARPQAEWIERLERADVPYATVNTIPDSLADPQLISLGSYFPIEHPTEGRLTAIHSPLHVDGERITPRQPAPTLGEHSDRVLRE